MKKSKGGGISRSKLTKLENAVCGAFAGMFAVCCSYPFDLIKTRTHFLVGATKAQMSESALAKQKYNMFSVGRDIVRRGGVLSLYRGLDQLLPEAALKTMLRFACFKQLQQVYRNMTGEEDVSFWGNLVSGALSGVVETSIVVQPFERGKTLRADFKSPYQVWGDAFRMGGIRSFVGSIYTGFLPCLGRQVGNQATSMAVFYSGKQIYLKSRPEIDELSLHQRLIGGFIAGCCACFVTMPLDVIKSIAQKSLSKSTERSMIAIARQIVVSRGIIGLYAGLTPRLLRVGLDRAFGFMAFDTLADWIVCDSTGATRG